MTCHQSTVSRESSPERRVLERKRRIQEGATDSSTIAPSQDLSPASPSQSPPFKNGMQGSAPRFLIRPIAHRHGRDTVTISLQNYNMLWIQMQRQI
ncbi:hypothetical protein LZ554_006932 [Drepanopeziza brunnea f. sp. 'monogermtubi']|nr:hypothetical protein LZ554_006932 [Drepanopeziza brunnea f. sp. 'monogermtubi']